MIRLHSRILWLLLLVAHALGGVGWWAMMPGGFPVDHPRFWVNRVLPAVVAIGIVAAIVAAKRDRRRPARDWLVALTTMYVAMAVTMVALFPQSGLYPAAIVMVGAGVMALAAFDRSMRGLGNRGTAIAGAVVGVAIGVAVIATQRAPQASTLPSAASTLRKALAVTTAATAPTAPSAKLSRGVVRLGGGVSVHPGDGSLDLAHDRLIASLYPLLTFTSRSPDRFWTCFASRAARQGSQRVMYANNVSADAVRAGYVDDGESSLDVTRDPTTGAIDIAATSTLPAAVYSHLNTSLQLHVAGHRKLAISFSPCPEAVVEFTTQDGRPSRLAYVDATGRFHVVEASQGEKGPFRPIASGPLAPGEPLTLTLLDEGRPALSITLHDWSAQASTELSPTAGWGLPQNAIEFSLSGDGPRSAASIYVTLAATSVGRGFDSVGHAAGTYVNRVTVRTSDDAP